MTNFTPRNIFDSRGKKLTRSDGAWIQAKTDRHGQWVVVEEYPPSKTVLDDRHMLPQKYETTESIDVWTACRMLNEFFD